MEYPQHLLPQSNYKKIEWSNNLGECSLVRHTNTQDIFMPGTKAISTDKIKFPSEHFNNDLSTNLLSVFRLEDLYIQILNNELIQDWIPQQDTCCPIIEKDFIVNKNRAHFALTVNDVLNLNSALPLIENKLRLEVLHTPTKCNFWHFSIRVYENNIDVSLLPISEKQKIKLWRKVRNILADIAYYIEEETSILTENHYICN